MSKFTSSLIYAVVLSSALAACGGGSGGADNNTPPGSSNNAPPTTTITSFTADGGTATTHTAVVSGQSVYLNWSTNSTSNCSISGSYSASNLTSAQVITTAPAATTSTVSSYTLTCGTATATASITVLPARTAIPDAGFQQALTANGITVASDGTIDTTAALSMSSLLIEQDYRIVKLTGIGSFMGLTKLHVWNNASLTDASETSGLTNLTEFSIYMGAFTSIDVSKMAYMQTLGLTEIVGLSTVDTSMLTGLTEFDIQADCDDPSSPWGKTQGMTSIDISHNVNLEYLNADCQLFSSIDTSHNSHLAQVAVSGNSHLTSLDLSHNPLLLQVAVYGDTNLTTLNLKGTNGGQLLQRLVAYSTPSLTTITVSNASLYTSWMATATQTVEQRPDGTTDTLYTQNVGQASGSIGLWLMPGTTFSN